jgi:hypothetical protein
VIKIQALTRLMVLSIISLNVANADILSPFFTKNSAKSLFTAEISLHKAGSFILLPENKVSKQNAEIADTQQKAEALLSSMKLSSMNQNIPATQITQETASDPNLTPEQALLQKYGNPFEPAAVNAIKDAPKPFQAMIEALHSGQDELAFKYAIQYVRYQKDMEEVNKKAISLIGQGSVREGVLPVESWASSPEHQEYFYLRNIDLGEPKVKEEKVQTNSKLSLKAKELLLRAKENKHALINEVEKLDSETLELDEEEERARARQELKGRVPVDPKGQVDVYFFFNPKDKVAMGIAQDIENIYQNSLNDEKIEFIGMTIKQFHATKTKVFKDLTNVTFPILGGSALAEQLNISKSPSLVLITRNTLIPHVETEIRSFYYLDELMKIMKGEM